MPTLKQQHKPDPYVTFKDDQLRLAALKHLERHRTIRQLAIAAGSAISALAWATVFLLRTGWLTTH